MKTLTAFQFLFLTSAGLSLLSCQKKEEPIFGCRDRDALNYNPAATMADNSCLYQADRYAGNYIAYDTTSFFDFNTGNTVFTYKSFSFTISKTGQTTVSLNNFDGCPGLAADVNPTRLYLQDNSGPCGIHLFVGQFNGTKLRYYYQRYAGGDVRHINGTAIKQ